MLLVYIGLTTALQQFLAAKAHGKSDQIASILALFFIFAHSPMYNIGNNALTYSASHPASTFFFNVDANAL
jgi:hypothetical protein